MTELSQLKCVACRGGRNVSQMPEGVKMAGRGW